MTVELLVTTMNQNDISLVKTMNIRSDAIICNQCGITDLTSETVDGNRIRLLSTETKGKSVNQNIGMTYISSDIILFSDDDLIFVDDYKSIIAEFFENYPKADAVKFYCKSTNPKRELSFRQPSSIKKAKKRELMSAGTPCLAVKKSFITQNSVFFHPSFGPGTDCPNGEDSLFYNNLFKKKATVYVCPTLLAYVAQEESSWFKEFDEKYFVNSGRVYKSIYGMFANLFILRKAIIFCRRKDNKVSFLQMIHLMKKGKRSTN